MDYLRRDIGYSEISMGISGTTQDGVTTWTYTFILTDVNYYTTAAQEREMDQKVSRVLSSLALDGKSQKEKIDAIYNYLIRNVKMSATRSWRTRATSSSIPAMPLWSSTAPSARALPGPSTGLTLEAASTAGSSPVTP